MNEAKIFLRDTKRALKSKNSLDISLLSILFIQFVICCYFNLASIRSHIGFDASWSCLRTVLICNEKTLSSPMWVEQNNLFFDSSTLLAVPFFAVTKNIFLSFGIVNIIVLLLILWAMGSIISMLELNMTSKLFALNLIICPFMTNGYRLVNDIRYFNNVISGASHSAFRSFIALMIIYEFIRIKKQKKFAISTYVTFALCVLSGAGIGVFLLILMLIPYMCYVIEMVFIKNTWKELKSKESIFGIVCSGCILFGEVLTSVLASATISDTTKTWTSIEDIWKNTGAVFQGFLGLLNVLPLKSEDKVSIMSFDGIIRLFPLCILAVILIAFIYATIKICKNYNEKDGSILFIINIIVINFVSFSLFNVHYGGYLFEDRYLITTFFATIILISYLVNNLDRTKIYATVLCAALTVSVAGNDLISDINYLYTENYHVSHADAMIEIFNETNDSDLVYVWGYDNVYLESTIRLYDLDRYYKLIINGNEYYHFGDYTYYDDNSEYSGPTYLVVRHNCEDVPDSIMSQYTFVKAVDYYDVYRCESNPINIKTT